MDSTPLSERMDPEDYRQMILDYHNAAEKVIERHGGKVGNYLGDGLLVYFGYPIAHEDQVYAAVRTGLDIVERVGDGFHAMSVGVGLDNGHHPGVGCRFPDYSEIVFERAEPYQCSRAEGHG